jgi:hypothetical protein
MTLTIFTADTFREYVQGQYDDQAPDVLATVQRWLDRGDGAAVYENHDLGHPDAGMPKIVSYGSPAAQLEMAFPPERLPDIGGEIGWRYVLIGTWSNFTGPRCKECSGELGPNMVDRGLVHVNDADDTHTPVHPDGYDTQEVLGLLGRQHDAKPADGATVYDRDGNAAGERTRMAYPLVSVCTCGESIERPGRHNRWAHRVQ